MEIKKIAMATGMSAMLVAGMGSAAFADNTISNDNGADNTVTPLKLTQGASSYDFEVTEVVYMSASANEETLAIDSFKVTNKANVGLITYSQAAAAAEGYTLVADNHDFSNDAMGAKKFSMVADYTVAHSEDGDATGAKDMSTGVYANSEVLNADGGEETTTYTGGISPSAQAITDATKVGTLTATVSWVVASYDM